MSQGECLSGDWGPVGYQDGANGHPPSRLDDHAKACAAYGVRTDAQTYLDARERGLGEYCRPQRGYREGRMGRRYHGVCPPRLAAGFLAGYDDGRRLHAAEEHRDEIRREVSRFDRRINDIEDELEEIAGRLGAPGLDDGTRRSLEADRRDLRRELRQEIASRNHARRQERAAEDHATRLRIDLTG
ncbi:MAG: DUF2799 domain-containing protein, partial [Luteimonas sp.]